MKNNITTKGLNNIVGHLRNRIKGYVFKEISVDDIGLMKEYSLFHVQTAAEKMMQHLAMIGYTPIIELIDLPDGIAGRTNLNDDKLVYISLDKKHFITKYYTPAQLLTIIAHELCHKFLWVHGFKETSQKIEYVTVACAVYVGFGKLLIEGIEVESHSYNGCIHMINTQYLGYLEKWQIEYLRNVFYDIPIPYISPKRRKDIIEIVCIFAVIILLSVITIVLRTT